MIAAEVGVRAWIEPAKKRRRSNVRDGWRSAPYGNRVLVFDTETKTDRTQRLLFGFFQLWVDGNLLREGLFVAEDLSDSDMEIASRFARIHRIELMTREAFVHEVFYPQVYELGALCAGFNLPFDLTRIAEHAGPGRKRNARAFSVLLSRRIRWPRVLIESASARAAFIRFAHKKQLANWEKPLFRGRFVDLSTVVAAFTGERHTLKSACIAFDAERKSETDDLGSVTPESLAYGRQDVRATLSLYLKVMEEYQRHPFATTANERQQPAHSLPITRIYSAASIAKAYLDQMGVRPFLEKQPRFPRPLLGKAAAAYFGGRAEVRVRRMGVPVTVLDFTSMYPTVFILQKLQEVLVAKRISTRKATIEARRFLERVTLNDLYDPSIWPMLRCLVRVRPNGAVLPVRMRTERTEPFTIAITPFYSHTDHWYTLADVISAKILGGSVPDIIEAVAIVPSEPDEGLHEVFMRNATTLSPNGEIFKTVIEQRRIAKDRAKIDGEAARLDMALKIMANSGAYGIFAEVNAQAAMGDGKGTIHSDETIETDGLPSERPGRYCNPIIASLVTGSARLMLAMLEAEVARRGGTYAFCDTDSLAIVTAPSGTLAAPSVDRRQVDEIVRGFDRLNPYDPSIIPGLLKVEAEGVYCWAVSAKRYCLYRRGPRGAIEVVKASESGLGGILGRSEGETTSELAQAVWRAILAQELGPARGRPRPPAGFDLPLRRKFPLAQPAVLKRAAIIANNDGRTYGHQIKPFNFLQVLTASVTIGTDDVLPIAPYERSDTRARKLQWMDLRTGRSIAIDWDGAAHAGTVPVVRMNEYVNEYGLHPESKAADADGKPCNPETRGLLHRLPVRMAQKTHVGKEVDRLDEDEGWSVEPAGTNVTQPPVMSIPKDALAAAGELPRKRVADRLKMTTRRLQDILAGRSVPRDWRLRELLMIAAEVRMANGS